MNSKIWKIYEKNACDADEKLGARLCRDKTSGKSFWVFKIWSPSSSRVEIDFFAKGDDAVPFRTESLSLTQKGIWELSIDYPSLSIFPIFYEYRITNAGVEKKCLDPYAFSMAAYKNDQSCGRAALVDFSDERMQPMGLWPKGDCKNHCDTLPPFEDNSKAIVYECSVRDMTISSLSPESDSEKKGTYLGFVQAIPYIRELGVTHIQLMPVLNFYNNDETNRSYENSNATHGNNYNWGYDPHNYFTPEGWFSTDAENPFSRVSELKTLIKEAHKNGLRVILDVVYNHMARVEFLNDIVPDYYFRLSDNGDYKSNSGCGNDVATEHKMARKLICDSLVYWLTEYHVDGFRFDLMGLIDIKTVEDSYRKCRKIKQDVLFIGEGWKMYNGRKGTWGCDQNYVKYANHLAVFNDEFRDLAKAGGMNECGKGFLTGANVSIPDLFCNICGKPASYYSVNKPSCNVQYFDCHDGMTLHDTIVNNIPVDETSFEAYEFVAARIKLANALLLTSQGIAFLHSGQECGRTKNAFENKQEVVGRFVRNSYNSSDSINEFNWFLSPQNRGVLDYTKKLIALRKKYQAFWIPSQEEVMKRIFLLGELCKEQLLVYKILDWGGDWILIFNSSFKDEKIELLNPKNFRVFVDEKDVYLDGKKFCSDSVVAKAGSALIFHT